jgi:thymidine phosphorylase
MLGAGRDKKSDAIDSSVGIYLNKKTGEFCSKGETYATVFANSQTKIEDAKKLVEEAFKISTFKKRAKSLVYKIIN